MTRPGGDEGRAREVRARTRVHRTCKPHGRRFTGAFLLESMEHGTRPGTLKTLSSGAKPAREKGPARHYETGH